VTCKLFGVISGNPGKVTLKEPNTTWENWVSVSRKKVRNFHFPPHRDWNPAWTQNEEGRKSGIDKFGEKVKDISWPFKKENSG